MFTKIKPTQNFPFIKTKIEKQAIKTEKNKTKPNFDKHIKTMT